MSLIAILGRQPEIGVAELESVLGSNSVLRVFQSIYAEIDAKFDESWANRLGGSLKIIAIEKSLNKTEWRDMEHEIINYARDYESQLTSGKLTVGLSTYGLNASRGQLQHASINIKKQLRAGGRSIRLVPNSELAMNSAQVLHNKLTSSRGLEICAIRDGKSTFIGKTVWSQNIEAYKKRDQVRPMRDTRVGMLPPKLAQIIVNLAVADTNKNNEIMLLDPFCGTGVVLQEAALMGFSVYGTDVEPRMIEYSIENLSWLKNKFKVDFYARVELGDATSTKWRDIASISSVACETYLGAPMAGKVTLDYIEQERHKVQKLLKESLLNISKQISPGTRCCFAVPAWFFERRTITLPLIDQITDMGYNLVSFRHTSRSSMIYHREDQVVGRQLITCIKK